MDGGGNGKRGRDVLIRMRRAKTWVLEPRGRLALSRNAHGLGDYDKPAAKEDASEYTQCSK